LPAYPSEEVAGGASSTAGPDGKRSRDKKMANIEKPAVKMPTKGRTVFYCDGYDEHPGIVTRVYDDGTIDLVIFGAGDHPEGSWGHYVPFVGDEPADFENIELPVAYWPPRVPE
jgi:hypothetical protein